MTNERSPRGLFSSPPLYQIWLWTLFAKLVIALLLPLSADESYYWIWSKNLQLSYYDHPPMVAWLFGLASWIDWPGTWARWPFVVLGHFSLWIWLHLLKDWISPSALKWWLMLALLSPLIGFGSLIGTPDVPLVFFWSLSLYYLIECLNRPSALKYALLGSSLGLGFLSKYHIVLFVPILVTYLTLSKKWHLVKWRYTPLLIVMGLIFCLPVLIWNYQNEWISFVFQLNHGLGESQFKPKWLINYILGTLLVILPPIFYLALRAPKDKNLELIHYFCWGPILFFLLTSLKGSVELNWPIAAYPALFALAASSRLPSKSFWIKASATVWVIGFVSGLIVLAMTQNSNYRKYFERITEITELEALYDLPKNYQPLYASSYQMASTLWYQNRMPVYKLNGLGRVDYYDFQEDSHPTKTPFYVVLPQDMNLPTWVDDSYHTKVIQLMGRFHLLEVSKQ